MAALPNRADVVVVGGGLAGLATAAALTRRGTSVVVLERESAVGRHASGRNAAMCRALDDDDAVTRLAVRGAALLADPPAGLPRGLVRQSGSILVAETEERLAALVTAARRNDLPHRAVGPSELAERWPLLADARTGAGAIAFPRDGIIAVERLLEGLVRAVEVGGGLVVRNAEVAHVERDDDGARLGGTHGSIGARVVVIAGGAWSAEVGARLGGDAPALTHERRHIAVSGPTAAVSRDAPFVWFEGARELYVRPDAGAVLMSACDRSLSAPCDPAAEPDALVALADRLAELAPGLATLPIASVRACLRTFAADRRPRLGWDVRAPDLYWVAALGGHGATTSLALGNDAAAAIAARLS